MSYLALARKWRPKAFNQVVGQAHVLTALENALEQNRLHHAYLFSGTRGVGKTTIGRLFAKGLNCETGITSKPCGQCDSCMEIDQGRHVDLLEIDAASRTKVEDTRELLDNVQYKPARGRFKIYLIDEVHMLSRHSFNALLKTLEEPPEYVKFLLATTDPQKLPVTILSRCLQFHLKPISVDTIHEQLDTVLAKESVISEARALGMIAHAADGSMRDALSLTDQAIALGNGSVSTDTVSHMLGTLDTDQALHILQAIATKQPQAVMDCVQSLAANGVEWDNLLQELANQLHRIAMYQALPSTLDKTQPDAEKLTLLAQQLTAQDTQLFYEIALKGRQDLPFSPNERTGLEMTLLRMLAFRPAQQSVVNAISTQVVAQPQANVQPAPAQPMQAAAPSEAQPPMMGEPPMMAPEPYYDPMPEQYMDQGAPAVPPQSSHAPVQPQQTQSQQAQPPQAAASQPSAGSSIGGLRHQLRSRRGANAGDKGSSGKKSSAASGQRESVIERVAKKQLNAPQVSRTQTETNVAPKPDEPYQWTPMNPVVEKVDKELTPTQIKQSLEHEKTPEMVEKLLNESIAQSEWAELISRLDIPKLVEQLALNSYFQQQGDEIQLMLRPSQAHLNKDKAQTELSDALNKALGSPHSLSIMIGEEGQTPLELREQLYQARLQQAFTSLNQDKHVQFMLNRFDAVLDEYSVRPI
ncbi:DNA polymerase III subunit gamma/tau [Vibrio agarivorans]|uniref:DNA polymerase III subunit gamma/tau n=1 Tax=Vibrio agarivorans TaxID=153622 RepID=UPI0025B3690E|nr:DNA polymerase III subunit gamma/tau [Vibrio agarivorans]MDN3661201.1 DNA polymerase III subunit gamma/tau [Vibrio agarivorans]